MKLKKLEIKNFKSIEEATIDDIGDFDILCGKNNAGKTAIFEALSILSGYPVAINDQREIQKKYFSGEKFKEKRMEISLIFCLDDAERTLWIENYSQNNDKSFVYSLLTTSLLREIKYCFSSSDGSGGTGKYFGLSSISFKAADNKFAEIFRRGSNTQYYLTDLKSVFIPKKTLTSDDFNQPKIQGNGSIPSDQIFPFETFQQWIRRIYFFSPFRQSQRTQEAHITSTLNSNGENLVQRLYTIKQNEERIWDKLQEFFAKTLPDLGTLQTRVNDQKQTYTVVVDKKWNIEIDIHDMGSGIEQLLMIACVLIPQTPSSLIMLEAPEHHLHPGAQRTLLGFLRENLKGNQIMVTTHSPIFLSQNDLSIHVVTKTTNGTKVEKVDEPDDLSIALSELGSQNSDLLFADNVLFVEGPSDERILTEWGKKIGLNFQEKNILCIYINGGRNFDYYANSEVLEKITKIKVPHLFIIDKDEKSEAVLAKIKSQIRNVCILEKREIENYLLNGTAILEAMRIKAKDNPIALAKIESTTSNDIEALISQNSDRLKNLVLIKKIKAELGGGQFLPYESLDELIQETDGLDLKQVVAKICQIVDKNLEDKCGKARNLHRSKSTIL